MQVQLLSNLVPNKGNNLEFSASIDERDSDNIQTDVQIIKTHRPIRRWRERSCEYQLHTIILLPVKKSQVHSETKEIVAQVEKTVKTWSMLKVECYAYID